MLWASPALAGQVGGSSGAPSSGVARLWRVRASMAPVGSTTREPRLDAHAGNRARPRGLCMGEPRHAAATIDRGDGAAAAPAAYANMNIT